MVSMRTFHDQWKKHLDRVTKKKRYRKKNYRERVLVEVRLEELHDDVLAFLRGKQMQYLIEHPEAL